jgi:hypothetical protein
MVQLTNVPEWFGAALIGAALAAMGFVGKTIVESWNEARDARYARRAQLVELHSFVRAAQVTFVVQNGHAVELLGMVERHHPDVDRAGGFEQAFATAFPQFSPQESELHGIIRAMTIHAMKPTNQALLEWLRRDVFFRGHSPNDSRYGTLAKLLADLEAHLLLWHAKYEAWVPDHPTHALVYMADESSHGLGFPAGIDSEVSRLLGKTSGGDR